MVYELFSMYSTIFLITILTKCIVLGMQGFLLADGGYYCLYPVHVTPLKKPGRTSPEQVQWVALPDKGDG